MKLELKHLAPYLPYGLKLTKDYWGKIGELVPFIKQDFKGLQIELDYAITTQCKPILRPLSDLTKKVEINGEFFVPIMELFKMIDEADYIDATCDGVDFNRIRYQIDDEWNHVLVFDEALEFFVYDTSLGLLYDFGYLSVGNTFELLSQLHEWHFDMFDLIPNNLAIDINSIKQ